MNNSVLNDFSGIWNNGQQICLMPVPRLILDMPLVSGSVRIYPADRVNFEEIGLVSWPEREWTEIARRGSGDLEWAKSASTGLSLENYSNHTIIAFPLKINWERFLSGEHEFHKDILHEAIEIAEQVLDVIRYDFCRMELPETLPGSAGTFEDRASFSSAIFYSNNPDNESYMIGAEVLTQLTVCGLGLEINSGVCLTEFGEGEVGNIIRQGLSLRTQAMEANTLTTKFIMSMSVIDFLAEPNGYVSLKNIGKIVGRHCAQTKQEYNPLLRRLEELTGGKGSGIRTKLVHEGHRLETY